MTEAERKARISTLADQVIDSCVEEDDGVDVIAGVIADLAQYLADTINPR